jgi:predicted enzyme related to lactoylglutathione lyase
MNRVVHFEIHAEDPDRAERFYADVFGWTITRWKSPVDYRLLSTGEGTPGIDGAIMARGEPLAGKGVGGYVCTVSVEDLGATERRVLSAGGQRVRDRQAIPGIGLHAYFKDTEGNIFGALQPAARQPDPPPD